MHRDTNVRRSHSRWTSVCVRRLACYPAAWRARYGAEVQALIEESGASLRTVIDVSRTALDEWLREVTMKRLVGRFAILLLKACAASAARPEARLRDDRRHRAGLRTTPRPRDTLRCDRPTRREEVDRTPARRRSSSSLQAHGRRAPRAQASARGATRDDEDWHREAGGCVIWILERRSQKVV
jgi:hypothetical protein